MSNQQFQFKTDLFDNLRKLVGIIDELRDVGLQDHISLPRIAVMGSQSSGKSSLLEAIVGLDFLPRGDGVVTRRPLELRLVHSKGLDQPYAVFDALKDQKFFDFDQVRVQIDVLTDQIAGKKKGIIEQPILLTVYSNDCPDLTLIDLPGITRIPLANSDQPENIEEVTKNMALKYVKDERTIILCVIPANADMSTSDGLMLARKVDPQGIRTIGVITKIDIMDRGTNAKKMIEGQDIPLTLGYVGVKGRSQEDIINKRRIRDGLNDEQDFFAKHPIYSTIPSDMLGTKALINKLTTIMRQHIKRCLPQIIKEINEKTKECEDRLKQLGPSMPRDARQKLHLLWNMITDFTENYKNQIRGKYDGQRNTKLNQEISGGAMIKQMFNDLYHQYSKNEFKATSRYRDEQIKQAIILHQGDSIPGFPSIDSFMFLITPLLQELKEPAIDCLNDVYSYLEGLVSKLIQKIFVRFPSIQEDIIEYASRVLQDEKNEAQRVVENIIDAEQGYLYTSDLDYLKNRTNILPKSQEEKDKKAQQQQIVLDSNKILIDELRARIDSYFAILIRNLRDSVPKAVGFFLVKSSQEKMQFTLYQEIMKNEDIINELGEPPHIAQERETIERVLSVLKKAQKVLKKDPELASYEKSLDFEEKQQIQLKQSGN